MFLSFRNSKWFCLGVLAMGGTACGYVPVKSAPENFVCDGGREFLVLRDGRTATVRLGEKSIRLTAKKSNIGDRYTSDRATLIVDQGFAAFVSDEEQDLMGCRVKT
jgi:hypothetical protein